MLIWHWCSRADSSLLSDRRAIYYFDYHHQIGQHIADEVIDKWRSESDSSASNSPLSSLQVSLSDCLSVFLTVREVARQSVQSDCPFVCLSVYSPVFFCLSDLLTVCQCDSLTVRLSNFLTVWLSDYQTVWLTVWLSDCLTDCLTFKLSDCLSVRLSRLRICHSSSPPHSSICSRLTRL